MPAPANRFSNGWVLAGPVEWLPLIVLLTIVPPIVYTPPPLWALLPLIVLPLSRNAPDEAAMPPPWPPSGPVDLPGWVATLSAMVLLTMVSVAPERSTPPPS